MSEGSVYGAVSDAAARWPERPALHVMPGTAAVYGIEAGEISYRHLLERADDWAERLTGGGVAAGMRVAVLLENRPEYFAIWLGLNRLGASIVPVNPELRVAELAYQFGHSEPVLVIAVAGRIADMVEGVRASGLGIPVVAPGDDIPLIRGNVVVEEREGSAREAAVLYTSGTTGAPKGCVLANDYFLTCGRWYVAQGGLMGLGVDGERMITPLPIFHMNAMACSFMAMVMCGGCLIALDRFHPSEWWADVVASQATCLHYLGVMPSILMGMEEGQHDRAHRVRFGFGAGIDPKLHRPFEERFGIPLVEAWAMTETGNGAVIAANEAQGRLVGQSCLGRARGWVDARVVTETGSEAGPDEPGELLVRNNGSDPRGGFFSHYYKDDAATKAAWEGGWFHTGDIVRRDDQGRFFFVDRKKNVIRRSGENIAAVEVESVLMRHPEVLAAGVAAVPDPIRGEEVFACLKVAEPSRELAIELTEWALGQIAYYKVPAYIAFLEELPLTATQKIQRKALKALARGLIDDPDTVVCAQMKKRQVA